MWLEFGWAKLRTSGWAKIWTVRTTERTYDRPSLTAAELITPIRFLGLPKLPRFFFDFMRVEGYGDVPNAKAVAERHPCRAPQSACRRQPSIRRLADLDEAQLNAMFRGVVAAHRQAVPDDANAQLREKAAFQAEGRRLQDSLYQSVS